MQRKHKRIAMIIAIFLVAALVLPLVITALIPDAQGVTKKEIDAKKEEIKALAENQKKTKSHISSLRNERAGIAELKTAYDNQITSIEREIELIIELIGDINAEIAERHQALEEAREREAELSELYLIRLQAMEDMGEISYLSILLRAESLTDVIARWDAMQEIISRDKQLAEDLVETRTEIEEAIAQMEEDRLELDIRKKELADAQAELAELSAETDAMMAGYIAQQAKAEKELKDMEEQETKAKKELEEAEKEWARIQEAAKKKNNPYVGGEYLWPVPVQYSNVSSPWGMRKHPVYKVNKHHTGIDIAPIPKGTAIYAANAGEIITKTYSSGYGNYIAISHGGGQVTLYAHMSAFNNTYGVGSQVKKGDTIGYIGSTGVSTGNHLHFEIRVNGTDTDPELKLKPK